MRKQYALFLSKQENSNIGETLLIIMFQTCVHTQLISYGRTTLFLKKNSKTWLAYGNKILLQRQMLSAHKRGNFV